ncbi:MAG: hypothetical protein WDN06_16230 [Asticcacaulis sp.]
MTRSISTTVTTIWTVLSAKASAVRPAPPRARPTDVFTNYDGLGRITAKRFSSTTNTQDVFYAYDGLSRVTSTTDFYGRTVSYLYKPSLSTYANDLS